MGQLFASYASVDRERTLAVVDALRAQGLEVWIDLAGIAGGTAYGAEIANAVRDAEAVVLIASDASLASKNVRQEIMLAWRYDRPIIPLILHPLLFPDDVAYWLEGAQWIEVFDRPADAWVPKLWQALARHGIVTATPDTPPAQETAPPIEIVGNLPASLPSIFGREREIEEVLTLLANGRTITLTGPGGTGKTRLALEVGRRIGPSYAGGAWFLDLSSTRAAELVLPAIAALFEIDMPPDQPAIEPIARVLAAQPTLLILDNLEQILAAADDLARLQEAAPDLTLLMTSRAPLELPREWVYAVPQLVLPDVNAMPAVLLENPAVRLFVTRAQQAKPDFQLIDGNARAVAEICHRLDGLPLAIEIAAARVRMLPPAAMLTRLGSRLNLLTRGSAANARQQTLRDTIGWSYNLLEPEWQWAFRIFAVFEGGASVEAAESVLSVLDGETSEPPLDLLEYLVDQSLLVISSNEEGEPRLRMLETIREYAAEQLAESGARDVAQGAHVRYFLDWIEAIRVALTASRDSTAVRSVRGELANLRGALGWLRTHDMGDSRLRLVNGLFPYWRIAGPYGEANDELSAALAEGQEGDPRERAWALSALGWLAGARGSYDESIGLNEQALALFERMGERERQAEILWQLAFSAEFTGDYAQARAYQRQRLPLLAPDDTLAVARVENDLGRLDFIEGNFDEAIRLITNALEVYRQRAETQLLAYGLNDLASAEMFDGQAEASLAHIDECITLLRTLQDDFGVAVATATRGRCEQFAGDYERAQVTLEEALREAIRFGDANVRSMVLNALGVNAMAMSRWDEAESRLQEAFAVTESFGNPRRISETLETMAAVLVATGREIAAVQFLGRAAAERAASGTSIPPASRARYEQTVAMARQTLGAPRFDALVAEGRARDTRELIESTFGLNRSV